MKLHGDEANPTDATGKPARKPVNNLSSLLDSMVDHTEGDKVSVSDLLNAVGRRAYGPILALLGFVALSPLTLVPGANSFVAIIILLISMQMAVGKKYPWLPGKILRFEFPRKALVAGTQSCKKYVRPVDAVLSPRFIFLTEPPFAMLMALVCVASALVMIPLSFVPFGPVVPSLAVLLFGLGVTARDGIVLFLASASLFGAFLLLFRIWDRVSGLVYNLWPF